METFYREKQIQLLIELLDREMQLIQCKFSEEEWSVIIMGHNMILVSILVVLLLFLFLEVLRFFEAWWAHFNAEVCVFACLLHFTLTRVERSYAAAA